MLILSISIYRLNEVPIKIPTGFFTEVQKKIPKIHMESKKTGEPQQW